MNIRNIRGTAAAAAFGALALAACADPTASHQLVPTSPSFVVVGDATPATLTAEVLRVCKVWVGAPVADITATLNNADVGDISSPFTIPASTGAGTGDVCRVVSIRSSATPRSYSVTETDPGASYTVTWQIDSNDPAFDATGSGLTTGNVTVGGTVGDVSGGTPRGAVITFTNTFNAPPPPTSCTFTKGYYRNHPTAVADLINNTFGGTITVGGVVLTAAQAQAILDATPGKPNGISFQGNNLLLNATQQLITAILNGGASGPSSVQSAITSLNTHIVLTDATHITLSPANFDLSGDITTLTNFNEGTLAGFPHCTDS